MRKRIVKREKEKENNKLKPKPKKKVGKWLYWTPRALSILFILFIALFSLDVFDSANNYTFWQTVLALFMHNIPSFILIIFLILAWKWEWIGALGFLLFVIWYFGFTLLRNNFEWYLLAWNLELGVPALVVAVLWWLNWKRKM